MIEEICPSYINFQQAYLERKRELHQAGREAFKALEQDASDIRKLSSAVADLVVHHLFSGDRKIDSSSQEKIRRELSERTEKKIFNDFSLFIQYTYNRDPASIRAASDLFRYPLKSPGGDDKFLSDIEKKFPHLFRRAHPLPSGLELRMSVSERKILAGLYGPENGFQHPLDRESRETPHFVPSLHRYGQAAQRLDRVEELLFDLHETASKIETLTESKHFFISSAGFLLANLFSEIAH